MALLPIMYNVFLKCLKEVIDNFHLVPAHHGFRSKHSTIDQLHRLTDIIEKSFERKKICTSIFLDISNDFDRVWHKEIVAKLK